jgi:hypothetical protein
MSFILLISLEMNSYVKISYFNLLQFNTYGYNLTEAIIEVPGSLGYLISKPNTYIWEVNFLREKLLKSKGEFKLILFYVPEVSKQEIRKDISSGKISLYHNIYLNKQKKEPKSKDDKTKDIKQWFKDVLIINYPCSIKEDLTYMGAKISLYVHDNIIYYYLPIDIDYRVPNVESTRNLFANLTLLFDELMQQDDLKDIIKNYNMEQSKKTGKTFYIFDDIYRRCRGILSENEGWKLTLSLTHQVIECSYENILFIFLLFFAEYIETIMYNIVSGTYHVLHFLIKHMLTINEIIDLYESIDGVDFQNNKYCKLHKLRNNRTLLVHLKAKIILLIVTLSENDTQEFEHMIDNFTILDTNQPQEFSMNIANAHNVLKRIIDAIDTHSIFFNILNFILSPLSYSNETNSLHLDFADTPPFEEVKATVFEIIPQYIIIYRSKFDDEECYGLSSFNKTIFINTYYFDDLKDCQQQVGYLLVIIHEMCHLIRENYSSKGVFINKSPIDEYKGRTTSKDIGKAFEMLTLGSTYRVFLSSLRQLTQDECQTILNVELWTKDLKPLKCLGLEVAEKYPLKTYSSESPKSSPYSKLTNQLEDNVVVSEFMNQQDDKKLENIKSYIAHKYLINKDQSSYLSRCLLQLDYEPNKDLNDEEKEVVLKKLKQIKQSDNCELGSRIQENQFRNNMIKSIIFNKGFKQ